VTETAGATIRRAAADDAPAVADVWLRSRKASVPAIPPSVHTDDDVREWITTRLVPAKETWVVDDRGTIVAMLVLEHGWVDHLYVDPDHTGRGLGTRLIEHAKDRNPAHLDLWAFQSNVGARRFYERHGFVAVEMTDGDNEEGAPDVHYRWEPRDA
jgi:GNAT superfamily N-acetyltransferase